MTPSVKDFPLPRFPTTATTCSFSVDNHTWGSFVGPSSAKVPNQSPSDGEWPPGPSQIPVPGASSGGFILHTVEAIPLCPHQHGVQILRGEDVSAIVDGSVQDIIERLLDISRIGHVAVSAGILNEFAESSFGERKGDITDLL